MRPGVIASLRDIVPLRPLTRSEAMVIAERQATLLRKLLAIDGYYLDEHQLIGLPRIEVRRHSPWPSSGASQWINGRWVIVLNASEPAVRQRFSLCHELKHIIDHRFVNFLYRGLPDQERYRFVEGVCDYFAGCLLMPRPAVKRAWTTKTQQLDLLARRFHVSEAAMATRLAQVGLTDPTPRCNRPPNEWTVQGIAEMKNVARYQRDARSPQRIAAGDRA